MESYVINDTLSNPSNILGLATFTTYFAILLLNDQIVKENGKNPYAHVEPPQSLWLNLNFKFKAPLSNTSF